MGILITCGTVMLFVASIAGSIIANIIASELYNRAPSTACWLIEKAVARLPKFQRQRYREEWYAHLTECPGKLAKLWHSIGCLYGSRQLVTALVTPMQAYASIPREGQNDFLLKIGTTAPHADGRGFASI